MSLEHAHKGYEYQDLFSAYHISNILLSNENATFLFDKKETKTDKFDDFTIITDTSVMKRQIKYSEDKILKKADFSGAKYDLALDTLFQSWLEISKEKHTEITLCLAWEYIEDEKLDFLVEVDSKDYYLGSGVKVLTIDLEKIWPLDATPISTWRRLREKVRENEINREEFSRFISALKIEVNLPRSSINLNEPGHLEKLLLRNLRQFGVGKYPNNKKEVVDVAMHLMHIIKHFRAKVQSVEVEKIVYDLGLMKSFGNISQEFVIDSHINIPMPSKYDVFLDRLYENKKICLIGAPGSGKSWFMNNFKDYLENKKINVVEHYCYTGINDDYEKERITVNIFLANLISDILKRFPNLEQYKLSKFGVDFEELQTLLNNISEEVVLIVDGLDHIGRVYNMHKDLMRRLDTEIVEIISSLYFPENIKVVLASQPDNDILALQDKGFELFNIEPWDIYEVEKFMKNNGLENVKFSFEYSLADLLFEKSEGNPLYLTYIVNEVLLYSPNMVFKEIVEGFPPYNENLEAYYLYLMSKLDETLIVPQVLAGSPFPLDINELKDITGMGKYVTSSIEVIRSILSYNSSSGGYMIYHESFRRFILNLLEKNELSVEKVIYDPLIDWLSRKGIYENKKSYINLLNLLFESKKYDKILDYNNKEFIIESIYHGNNIKSINKNFDIIMKAACKVKDYGEVIKCTELNAMLISFKITFEENFDDYYISLGSVNGFENLKGLLYYENEMALSLDEGLKVCYLCSQNLIVPDWEKYINSLKQFKRNNKNNQIDRYKDLEYYKYYICGNLDMGTDMMKILSKITHIDLFDYRKVVIEEYSRRDRLHNLREVVQKINDSRYWIQSINEYLGRLKGDKNYLSTMFKVLEETKPYSEDTYKALYFYTNNIRWIILNHNEELHDFIANIKDKNWYYNWLVFIYETNNILIEMEDDQSKEFELVASYRWLIKDTDFDKGEPRTFDLLNYQSIIYESIANPLKSIESESVWEEVLQIIQITSSETMSTMQGAVNGPLPTSRLLNLLLDIVNPENNRFISEIFKRRIEDEGQRRLYTYLAEYSLKYTILLSKNNRFEAAKTEFRKSIQYLLSYGSRRDQTFGRLLNSVSSIYSIDNEQGMKRILNLKPLADAVVAHTDGKDTDLYPIEWFQILTNHDKELAIIDLSLELMNYDNSWILEECFDFVLEKIANSINPVIENALFKTRPGNANPDYLDGFLDNILGLISNDEISLATQSFSELLARFSNEIRDLDPKKFESICNQLNITHNLKLTTNSHTDGVKSEKNKLTEGDTDKEGLENLIKHLSYEEVIDHVIKNGIASNETHSIVKFFENINVLNDKTKLFISSFVKISYDDFKGDKKNFIYVLDTVSLENSCMAYLCMTRYFIHRDGWGRKFTKKEFFTQAMNLDKTLTEQYFFDYLYSEFETGNYNWSVGDHILNALALVNHNEEDIIEYWDSLFEIIDFRLPEKLEYDFEDKFDEFKSWNDNERLLLLLISRFKFGESTRYKWLISSLDIILSQPKYRKQFVKPFQQYLYKIKNFTDYSFIVILSRILKWYTSDELFQFEFTEILNSIYPTENEAINYQIRKITGVEKKRSNANYINDMSVNDVQIYRYAKYLARSDKRLMLLEERNIRIDHIVDRFVKSTQKKETLEKFKRLLSDSSYNLYISNVYFHDVLTKEIATEIEKVLNVYAGYPTLSQLETELFELVIGDIDYIVANINSISMRPTDLEHPEDVFDNITDFEKEEWCRVAYYEKWYLNRRKYSGDFLKSNDSVLITSGITFDQQSTDPSFLSLRDEYKQFDENHSEPIFNDSENEKFHFVATDLNINENQFVNFTTNEYFVIKNDLLKILNIRIVDNGGGIVGLDKANNVVMKYSRWEVCFEADNQKNYRIPYLKGAELKVKREIFEEVCNFFNSSPKRWTKKTNINN